MAILFYCIFAFDSITQGQIINSIAGNGTSGFSGDGGPASSAEFNQILGIAVDRYGNIYVADSYNNRIRKISPDGNINTIAGSGPVGIGTGGYGGDGGPALLARLNGPYAVAIDSLGDIYIADEGNFRVRKIDPTGFISTFAGSGLSGGSSADGIPATDATLNGIFGITLDGAGNIYITNEAGLDVRKVNVSGIITTYAGNGTSGTGGDGGPALSAQFENLSSLVSNGAGDLFISDANPNTVRKVNSLGIIATVAGDGLWGYGGDEVPATSTSFALSQSASITLDSIENIYISDNADQRIRKINSSGVVTTIAGVGSPGFSGDGGAAISAQIKFPTGIAVDRAGNVYFGDGGNNRIRKITYINHPPHFTGGHNESFTICENSGANSINALLAINDSDIGQNETWSTITFPMHGTLAAEYNMVSTGGIITPVGLFYTPAAGYSGSDSFRLSVTDGIAADTTTVHVTVNALPAGITGITHICTGGATNLGDATTGGTWSSSTTCIATISGSGAVTGMAVGTATISYSQNSCAVTVIVTVNPIPGTITGAVSVCRGATTIFSDGGTGTWSSSNIAVATVISSSGFVAGVSQGTATITYSLSTGCSATTSVTVYSLPGAVSGIFTLCPGQATVLTDPTGTGVWSSSNTTVATMVAATGAVTGVMPGTATISYTAPITGCMAYAIATVTPSPPLISGPGSVCPASTITLSDAITGGAWSSGSSTIATVSPTGTVIGISPGTAAIAYTLASGCIISKAVTVNMLPAIPTAVALCAGATATLTDATSGGTWNSSPAAIATVGSVSGTVSGLAAGTAIISYAASTGCARTAIVTVNPVPAITGPTAECIGAAMPETATPPGGTWISTATGVATIGSTGIVTGATTGTTTISYTSPVGCKSSTTIEISLSPTAIIGTPVVCVGDSVVLSNAVSGGVWSSPGGTVGIGTLTGVVTGITAGTTSITYSLGTGCTVTRILTVQPVSAITGSLGICVSATTALADAISGGMWSSSTTSVAGVSGSGIVTGALAGTATVTYTTAAGCTATAVVTVNLAPSAIIGILHVCAGATTTLSNTAGGGTWVSSNTGVAVVGSTGIVTGILHGTATITYSLGSGCTVNAVVTVNAAPAAISGTGNVCAGSTTALSDATTGGTWSIVPTVAATLSSAGIVTGLSAGTAIISFTISGGCAASVIVTVNTLPTLISGGGDICVGVTTTLTDGISGGIWSSGSTGIATANPLTGDITGLSPGSATITYTLPTGCSTNTTITINAAPAPISGVTSVCIGSIIALSDPPGTGIWSSSNTAVATISASGIVSGIDTGTATISYSAGGCPAIVVVTVNSLPDAISGTARVCAGSSTTLSDLSVGGTWSIPTTSIAAISSPATGGITGLMAGTATVAYSIGIGCTVTANVTVDALPSPIGGVTEVCKGYTTSLTDPSSGVWSSSNTAIATITGTGVVSGVAGGPATISYTNAAGCAATRLVTVVAVPPVLGVTNMCAFSATLPLYDSAAGGFWTSTLASISSSGVVTPYSAGMATITYTLPLGCYITATLTINPLPGPVTGLNHLCLGSTVSFSDTSYGGTWSSNTTAVASISAGGTVGGLSAGVSIISYTLGTGCATTETITVDAFPSAGAITGLSVVCVGADIILLGGAANGAWSASNTNASVGSAGSLSGMVSGVSAGTDIISYTVSNSCGSAFATKTITINPLPLAGTITGPSNICTGDSIVLADLATGGVWSSSTSVPIVIGIADSTVLGLSIGADTIKYTVTNSCGIAFAEKTVTVNTLPNAGTINGTDSICIGASFTLTDTAAGGVWSSSSGIVSITSSGFISAIAPGVDTITYSVVNTCGTMAASAIIAVKPGPLAGTITGGGIICTGTKDTLTGSPSGGDWSGSNGNVMVTNIPAGVIITGVSAGADTITYTLTNDCGQAMAVFPVTVYTIEECDSITATPINSPIVEQLHIWPNPTDGVFTVILSSLSDQPVSLVITNILGEKIKNVSATANHPATIKLNNAAGVYFVTASTSQGSYIAKIIFTQ